MYPPVTQFETRQRMILDELRVREERRLVRRSTPRIPRATRQRASATGGGMHRGQRIPGACRPRRVLARPGRGRKGRLFSERCDKREGEEQNEATHGSSQSLSSSFPDFYSPNSLT
jgi:hypothetical protein